MQKEFLQDPLPTLSIIQRTLYLDVRGAGRRWRPGGKHTDYAAVLRVYSSIYIPFGFGYGYLYRRLQCCRLAGASARATGTALLYGILV